MLDAFLASTSSPRDAVLDELRCFQRETATLHQYLADLLLAACPETRVVASIPVHSFPAGIVLAACERTYVLRAELRALGGVWRVVPTASGNVLGWAFTSETAQAALNLIAA